MNRFFLILIFITSFAHISSSFAPDSMVVVFCNELDNRTPSPNWNVTSRYIEYYDSLKLIKYATNASGAYPGLNFIAEDSSLYIHNAQGQLIENTTFQDQSGSWTPVWKYKYTYDLSGNMNSRFLQRWNYFTAAWDSNGYFWSHYNAQGGMDSSFTRSGQNSGATSYLMDSVAYQMTEITWNANGSIWNPVARKTTFWNNLWSYMGYFEETWTGTWVNRSRQTVIRDSLNRTIDNYYEVWDSNVGNWYGTDTRFVTIYDVAFRTDSIKYYWWQMGSGWYIGVLGISERDSLNRIISQKTTNLQAGTIESEHTSYNYSGQVLRSSYSSSNGYSNYTIQEYDNEGNMTYRRRHSTSPSGGYDDECQFYRFFSDSTVINLPDTIYSCGGAPVQPPARVIHANEPLRYSWTPNTGISSDTVLAPEFSVTANTNYVLTITDSLGNIFTRNVALIIQPLPVAAAIDTFSLSGHCYPDTLLITTMTQPGNTYIWYLSTGQQIAVNTDTIFFSNNGITQSYLYQVTDSFGCSIYSDTITVHMDARPYISLQTFPSEYCLGDTVVISASTSSGNLHFQWRVNGIDSIGANDRNLTIFQNGVYSFYLRDTVTGCDAQTDFPALFSPQPPPVSLYLSPHNALCIADTIYLISTNSEPSWQYSWSLNSTTLSIANNDSLQVTYPGTYSLEITDGYCPAGSASKTIYVDNFLIAVTPSGPVSLCDQDTLTLSAGSAESYLWSNGDTSATSMITSPGLYTVFAIDSLGCSNVSDTINVHYFPPSPAPFLTYQTSTLVSSYIGVQSWYRNGVLIPGVSGFSYVPNQSGDYTVSYIDSNGCLAVSQPYTLIIANVIDVDEKSTFRIFPNPVSLNSIIECAPDKKILNFELYNGQMQKVKEQNSYSSEIKLDRDGLISGIYFAKIQLVSLEGKTIKWIKIIVE